MTTIKYEQANPVPGKVLPCQSPDLFIFHMSKIFPEYQRPGPSWVLNAECIERLIGMGGCYLEPNPARELIRAIKNLGSIHVWAEGEKDADKGNDQVGDNREVGRTGRNKQAD